MMSRGRACGHSAALVRGYTWVNQEGASDSRPGSLHWQHTSAADLCPTMWTPTSTFCRFFFFWGNWGPGLHDIGAQGLQPGLERGCGFMLVP